MNWNELIGPAVVAAVISGLVVWLTSIRRFAVDRQLAERKIAADIALAEKKLALDQALVIWRRRYELAEQILTTAYEARDILVWVRAPVQLAGEGETRKAADGENDKLRERRNSYFVPIERLARETKTFSTLQTLRYAAAAHFGQDSAKPILAIAEVHRGISSAAGILIETALADEDHNTIQSVAPLRQSLGWGPRPDATDTKIANAVTEIEAICKPVLSEKPPVGLWLS